MNAGALVYCLLDAEGEYTPDGYRLLDTALAGDYELKLWQGSAHQNGKLVIFNEISFNAVGRSFDPKSQATKFTGSTQVLGRRRELLNTVAGWLKNFGELYVGSYNPKKLGVYYQMFKRYMPRLQVSAPYPAFDESEGASDYFKVTGTPTVVESILLETNSDGETERYVNNLPDVEDRAYSEAHKVYTRRMEAGLVNADNFCEMAEAVASEVVYDSPLATGNEVVDGELCRSVLARLIDYAEQNHS